MTQKEALFWYYITSDFISKTNFGKNMVWLLWTYKQYQATWHDNIFSKEKKASKLTLLTLAHLFISDKRTPVLSTMLCRVAWWPRVTISNTMMRTRKYLSESGQEIVEKYIKTVFVKYYVQKTNNRHYTGCPTKPFYNQFLGLWCTKNFYHGHFSTALSVGCSKLPKILKIEKYLTKLWRKN